MKWIKLLVVTSCLVVGCSDEGVGESSGYDATEAIATYAQIVHASYEDSLSEAQALDSAITTFVADPSQENLEGARSAWLASREPYLQTEVYRFYEGPIDNATDGPEGLMNAWPLDEAYIDYVEGDETAGIVNDENMEINEETLTALNAQGGEENVATGYHAIEFLLWGQDLSDDGPGNRAYTDYLSDETGTASNQDRRTQYLTTVSSMLVNNLSWVQDAWAPSNSENYRAEFESISQDEALARILTGMIVLSGFETGGERLQTALDSGDQEDEHSCFSDNTHRDMIQDIQGVLNVWQGSYERLDGSTVSGVGVRDLVSTVDEALAQSLDEQIAESLSLANALQPPFDQEIQPDNDEGRDRIAALVTSLQTQETLLEDVFRLFGLDVPVVE